jgi:hypothetical protein
MKDKDIKSRKNPLHLKPAQLQSGWLAAMNEVEMAE